MKKTFIVVAVLILIGVIIYLLFFRDPFNKNIGQQNEVESRSNINYKKSVDDRRPIIKGNETVATPTGDIKGSDRKVDLTNVPSNSASVEIAKEKVTNLIAKITEFNKKCQQEIDHIIPDKYLMDDESAISKKPKEIVKIFKQINQIQLISEYEGELNNIVKNEMPENMDVQWLYQQMEKAGDGCHSYKQIDLLMRTLSGPVKEKWSNEDKKAVAISVLSYFETQLEKPNLGLADLVKVSLLGELADQGLIDSQYKNEIVKISFEYMDSLNPGKVKFEDFQKSMDGGDGKFENNLDDELETSDIDARDELNENGKNKTSELKNLQNKVVEFNSLRERLRNLVTRIKESTNVQ